MCGFSAWGVFCLDIGGWSDSVLVLDSKALVGPVDHRKLARNALEGSVRVKNRELCRTDCYRITNC